MLGAGLPVPIHGCGCRDTSRVTAQQLARGQGRTNNGQHTETQRAPPVPRHKLRINLIKPVLD